jgi:hypothetical protein
MAQAKTETFDPALVRTACIAKALGHPVRIRILEILASREGCIWTLTGPEFATASTPRR